MLFTSAGRRVELLRSFRADAAALDVGLRIVACDLESRWSAACQIADVAYDLPAWGSADYVDAVLAICRNEGVDLVIPTVDPELLGLAEAAEIFAAGGCAVLVSDPSLIGIARDKLLTAQTLARVGVPVPKTCGLEQFWHTQDQWQFPVIAKPRDGSASSGLTIVDDRDALVQLDACRSWIIQERLQGDEYTVNMLFDRQCELVVAVPHQRRQVRAGEVEKGITVRHSGLLQTARRIAVGVAGARGALCFQAFVGERGEIGVFEINARFGGGYPLTHAAGAPFGQHILAEFLGLPLPNLATWRDGAAMLRYDAAIFR